MKRICIQIPDSLYDQMIERVESVEEETVSKFVRDAIRAKLAEVA